MVEEKKRKEGEEEQKEERKKRRKGLVVISFPCRGLTTDSLKLVYALLKCKLSFSCSPDTGIDINKGDRSLLTVMRTSRKNAINHDAQQTSIIRACIHQQVFRIWYSEKGGTKKHG